jgi:hypothetical protein
MWVWRLGSYQLPAHLPTTTTTTSLHLVSLAALVFPTTKQRSEPHLTHNLETDTKYTTNTIYTAKMPIWGLKTVAQVIATGFEGPQHCDEPWNYQFTVSARFLLIIHGYDEADVILEWYISLDSRCSCTSAARAATLSGSPHA